MSIQEMPDKHICSHKQGFRSYGYNRIGYATCLSCGQEVSGDVAFNYYFERMEKALEILEQSKQKNPSEEGKAVNG